MGMIENVNCYVKQIVKTLDEKDNLKNKISNDIWNKVFKPKEKNGKEIINYITVQNAELAIRRYLKRCESDTKKQEDLAKRWFDALCEKTEDAENETIEKQEIQETNETKPQQENSQVNVDEKHETPVTTDADQNAEISNKLKQLQTTSDSVKVIQQHTKYEQIIASCSKEHDIDPLLIKCIVYQESRFNPNACSKSGAKGLMQLMPGTARHLGVKNAYNPEQNINGGIKYFAYLMKKFQNNVQLALAAYNAGEGNVRKYGNVIPPFKETRKYVAAIIKNYNEIKQTFEKQPS